MQVNIEVNREGKPTIKASIDWSTGKLVTNLTLPIKASPAELADLATILSGDHPIQVSLTNPQLTMDGLFQNTAPGSDK